MRAPTPVLAPALPPGDHWRELTGAESLRTPSVGNVPTPDKAPRTGRG